MNRFKKLWIKLFSKIYWIIKGNKEIREIIISGHKIYLIK